MISFYEFAHSSMFSLLPEAELWKHVGDEAVYFVPVREHADLYKVLRAVHEAAKRTEARLANVYRDLNIRLTSAAWLAAIRDVRPAAMDEAVTTEQTERIPNIRRTIRTADQHQTLEFLGTDIDVGFRIAKHCVPGFTSVSANWAEAIVRVPPPQGQNRDQFLDKLRVVGHERLKGIWAGVPYPIVWYRGDGQWSRSALPYADRFSSQLATNVSLDLATKVGDDLTTILREMGVGEAQEMLITLIPPQRPPAISSSELVPFTPPAEATAELHCVAIVFRDDERLLIAHRPTTKARLPDCWEFGCTHLTSNQTFEECLVDGYRADFGGSISVVETKRPVATYIIERTDRTAAVPGLIFVASTEDSESFVKSKHDEIRWVTLDELAEFSERQLVPDAVKNAQLALVSCPASCRPINHLTYD